MKFISTTIFCIIIILNSNTAEADVAQKDDLTLRNQLFDDILDIKEGVHKLQTSVEVLNKTYINQMETLKAQKSDLLNNDGDSKKEDGICIRMFNATLRKYNELENRLVTKIERFEGKFAKFETLEEKLNLQQKSLDSVVEKQLKILQEINEKLAKNQEQFEKFGNDLTKLKDLKNHFNKVLTTPRPKLPMNVILGLTSSNVTTFK